MSEDLAVTVGRLIEATGKLWIEVDSLRARVATLEKENRDTRTDWLPGLDRKLLLAGQALAPPCECDCKDRTDG